MTLRPASVETEFCDLCRFCLAKNFLSGQIGIQPPGIVPFQLASHDQTGTTLGMACVVKSPGTRHVKLARFLTLLPVRVPIYLAAFQIIRDYAMRSDRRCRSQFHVDNSVR